MNASGTEGSIGETGARGEPMWRHSPGSRYLRVALDSAHICRRRQRSRADGDYYLALHVNANAADAIA